MKPVWKEKRNNEHMIKVGSFYLHVHRHIHYPEDKWFASCSGLFSRRELASKEVRQAQIQALSHLHTVLLDGLASMEDYLA